MRWNPGGGPCCRGAPRRVIVRVDNNSGEALEHHGHPLAATDAHRFQAEVTVPLLEGVDQGRRDAGTRHTEGMPKRDGTAVDVELLLIDAEAACRGNHLCGERLVDLDQVNVAD